MQKLYVVELCKMAVPVKITENKKEATQLQHKLGEDYVVWEYEVDADQVKSNALLKLSAVECYLLGLWGDK